MLFTQANFYYIFFYLYLHYIFKKNLSHVRRSVPYICDEFYTIALHLISSFDEVDDDENVDKAKSAVLIFLPGLLEINRMQMVLEDNWNEV